MKKLLIILIIFVPIVIAAGYFLSPFIILRDFQKSVNIDFSTVDKVTIASGNTGKKCDITGKENIQKFLSVFNGAKLKKDFDQSIHKGYIFSVTMYNSGKVMGSFNFGYNRVNVSRDNKIVRYISNKNISDSQLREISEKYNLL